MIHKIRLKFGKASGTASEEILATPVTVFVGPNNSGKSKVLSEIHHFCLDGQKDISDVILDSIEFISLTETVAEETLSQAAIQPEVNEFLPPEHVIISLRGDRLKLNENEFLKALQNPNLMTHPFCHWYLRYRTLILDGQSRINLVSSQTAGDLQQPPHTSFQVLFRDDSRRAEVRRILADAFDAYFVIDPTISARSVYDSRQ